MPAFASSDTEDSAAVDALLSFPADDPICRICLGSADEELGRLIRPCKCRGTIRHVHVNCLNEWCNASIGSKNFWKCDICQNSYRRSRTKISGLAQNKIVLGVSTCISFFLLVTISGWISTALIYILSPYQRLQDISEKYMVIVTTSFLGMISDSLFAFSNGDAQSAIIDAKRLLMPNAPDFPYNWQGGWLQAVWHNSLRGIALVGSVGAVCWFGSVRLFAPPSSRGLNAVFSKRSKFHNVGTLFIIFVVIGGAINSLQFLAQLLMTYSAIHAVYLSMQRVYQWVIAHAETAVLEVNEDRNE